jgi:hypothetical protein
MKVFFLSLMLFVTVKASTQNCPGIAVMPYTDEIIAGDTLMITAVTSSLKSEVAYQWKVNTGEIVSGQGTARVFVKTVNAVGSFITANVTLTGLPAGCATTASASAELISGSQLVVSGTFTNGQELKKAIQQFIASSHFKDVDNTATAFIYLYNGPYTAQSAFSSFKEAINGAFLANEIDSSKYEVEAGGAKKFATYEIYLLHKSAAKPKPSN